MDRLALMVEDKAKGQQWLKERSAEIIVVYFKCTPASVSITIFGYRKASASSIGRKEYVTNGQRSRYTKTTHVANRMMTMWLDAKYILCFGRDTVAKARSVQYA